MHFAVGQVEIDLVQGAHTGEIPSQGMGGEKWWWCIHSNHLALAYKGGRIMAHASARLTPRETPG